MTELTQWHEAQLVEILGTLAAVDGSVRLAKRQLHEVGVDLTEAELKALREQHGAMYLSLADVRKAAQEEAIVQEYREITRVGQRLTRRFMEDIEDQLDSEDGLPYDLQRQLPQIIGAFSKSMQVSTDKFLAMTNRPVDGSSGDPLQATKDLIAMGVLKPIDRPSVDGTAEEDPDVPA